VNGRVFVNNSSVGFYPHAVRARDHLRGRLGKWPAMAWAVLRVLLRFPRLALRLRWDGGVAPRRTPFVFVGNNRYDTALLATQRRPSLSGGVLGVYVSRRQGRAGLLWLAARALVGRLDAERDLEALDVPRLTLESRRRRLQVSAATSLIGNRTSTSQRTARSIVRRTSR